LVVTAIEQGTDQVLGFLSDAYGHKPVDHPLAVANLLRDARQPNRVVVAGLLHDVLEDTNVTADQLRRRFGAPIAELVEALTEDGGISDVRQRKAALRRQILDAGPSAATIALADKAAKLSESQLHMNPRRFEHYRDTLEGVERRYGRSRLSELLRRRLAARGH
jgi:(p)ppGpp synthase/HD superfamily hydrolase